MAAAPKTHEEAIARLALAYVTVLRSVDWSNDDLVNGLREGLNKFLSNAWLKMLPGTKHEKTHFISMDAKTQLDQGRRSGLVFEHIVPKQAHIQTSCEEAARGNCLDPQFVLSLLATFWRTATVTAAEDRRLARSMPQDWDRADPYARYRAASIILRPNQRFPWPTTPPAELV